MKILDVYSFRIYDDNNHHIRIKAPKSVEINKIRANDLSQFKGFKTPKSKSN